MVREEESRRHFRDAERALLGRRWTAGQAKALIRLIKIGCEALPARSSPEEFWRSMMEIGAISADEYVEVTGHKSVISRD
ncbi:MULTISPECIES: hypothetical protein [unclassified Sphingomonas]|uniref:hypothetical protein n=1 Tax=unclassified Sphingomonas TaxID=196159 RepID=UPI00226AEDFE|nr:MULTISPECIES: hypothetical protein [unclassified Sphingomonas]